MILSIDEYTIGVFERPELHRNSYQHRMGGRRVGSNVGRKIKGMGKLGRESGYKLGGKFHKNMNHLKISLRG